jgi:4-amino-4-deoxy-L-arabinose transferase-like glycosyltransferase
MPEPDTPTPEHNTSPWWLAWLVSTVVLPAVAGTVAFSKSGSGPVAVGLCILSFFLHFGSSARLDPKGGGLVLVLFFGGWVLMLAVFFAGCLYTFPHI